MCSAPKETWLPLVTATKDKLRALLALALNQYGTPEGETALRQAMRVLEGGDIPDDAARMMDPEWQAKVIDGLANRGAEWLKDALQGR